MAYIIIYAIYAIVSKKKRNMLLTVRYNAYRGFPEENPLSPYVRHDDRVRRRALESLPDGLAVVTRSLSPR